ncbi:MAG: hypothetical protein RQ826_13320 [Xanthomonadales bacterium]|nr:hypothetical protein [Xanthomonadales bacterium]
MMLQLARLLILCPWLAACQSTPPAAPDWADFLGRIDRMDAQQLQLAREALMSQYEVHPTDSNLLRAGYALSRPGASSEQLAQSREILAEIPPGSEVAPMRDLLDRAIGKSIELQGAELRVLELQAQLSELEAKLGELQSQLDALKSIEEEMVESQQQADELQP